MSFWLENIVCFDRSLNVSLTPAHETRAFRPHQAGHVHNISVEGNDTHSTDQGKERGHLRLCSFTPTQREVTDTMGAELWPL